MANEWVHKSSRGGRSHQQVPSILCWESARLTNETSPRWDVVARIAPPVRGKRCGCLCGPTNRQGETPPPDINWNCSWVRIISTHTMLMMWFYIDKIPASRCHPSLLFLSSQTVGFTVSVRRWPAVHRSSDPWPPAPLSWQGSRVKWKHSRSDLAVFTVWVLKRLQWREGAGEEGVSLAVTHFADCLRFCINGMFSAASLLTGP